MEAARVAALRGHKVTLYEKESKLGGLLSLAAMLKDVEVNELLALIHYLTIQMKKAGVTVKLKTEVTPALIAELKPDVVILAAGGIDSTMDIPGVEDNVRALNCTVNQVLFPVFRSEDNGRVDQNMDAHR